MIHRRSLALGGNVAYARTHLAMGGPKKKKTSFGLMDVYNSFKDSAVGVYNALANVATRYADTVKKAIDDGRKARMNSYIGGTKEESRAKFWEQDPEVSHAVDSVSKLNGINPAVLRRRLDEEGFTDAAIKARNDYALHGTLPKDRETGNIIIPWGRGLLNSSDLMDGYNHFGLDDGYDYIKNGMLVPRVKAWYDDYTTNESGRRVHFVTGSDVADNMSLTAGMLKGMRDKLHDDFPNLTDKELDDKVHIYYQYGPYAKSRIPKGKKKSLGGVSSGTTLSRLRSHIPTVKVQPLSKFTRRFNTPAEQYMNDYKMYLINQLL